MVFSSITFLYYFLPILLIFYFIVPTKMKNLVLLIFSLLFYFYGEPRYIGILILSVLVNYFCGILIGRNTNRNIRKILFILNIIFNVGLLFYFKYTDFFISNINLLFGSDLGLLRVIMPIGISFFTFQTMSYVIDVYMGNVKYI